VTIGAPRQNGDYGQGQPEMAQRWMVKAHIDDNVCEPCKGNDGKLYRSRADAYKDYPNGRGYKKCVGAQYGNTCRCRVIKRGRAAKNEGAMPQDLEAMIAKARSLTVGTSARALTHAILESPRRAAAVGTNPPMMAMQDFRAEGNSLYLYDAIGGWDGTQAIDVAQALAGMTGPVDLHINSPGGIIFEGAAIYNALKQYAGGPVTSWIDGYAASAASFVMLAASPYDAAADTGGVRMAKNAFVMIHDGMGLAMGTEDDMRDVADLLGMLSDSIAGIYAVRAGGTPADWRDIMRSGDTWYSADSAKADGLVDLIIGQDAPPEPDEPQPGPLDIGLFQPTARAESPVNNVAPFDLEGLRIALKGAIVR
jgi:ATP-dependent protease ClpP protease subunit